MTFQMTSMTGTPGAQQTRIRMSKVDTDTTRTFLLLITQERHHMKHFIQATHLYHHPTETNLALGLLFWILVIAGETFRRVPVEESLQFWEVVPPLLFPLWVQYWNVWDLFLWAKTISLIPVAVVWSSVVRMGVGARLTRIGTFIVLSTNISEAVAKDMLTTQRRIKWNRLNALSGILLILSELLTLHTARISNDGMRDFLWTHGPSWIIGK